MKRITAILSLIAIMVAVAMQVSSVMAISQPLKPTDPFAGPNVFSITAPVAPSTGECNQYYAESGSYCSGGFRIYKQCIQTLNGGQWQQRTENCELYGSGGTCQNGACIIVSGGGGAIVADNNNLAIAALAILALCIIFKSKKRR